MFLNLQVWFQNSRARDRREAKIPGLVPLSSLNNHAFNDQPLDLSKKDVVKKEPLVKDLSDASSRNTISPCGPKEDALVPKLVKEESEDVEESPLVIDEETTDSAEVKQPAVPTEALQQALLSEVISSTAVTTRKIRDLSLMVSIHRVYDTVLIFFFFVWWERI